MKIQMLTLWWCCIGSTLFSQTVTVSEPLSTRRDVTYELIGEMEGQTLVFQDQLSSFHVQAMDEKLSLSWKKELELDPRRPQVINVSTDLQFFSVLYTYRNNNRSYLKVHKYDAGANLVDSITIKEIGFAALTTQFKTIVSEDKQRLLIYEIQRQKEITAYSFDLQQMKLDWEYTFAPDDLLFNRDYAQMLVDNKGNLYLILQKENRKKKEMDHHFEVLWYGPGNDFNIERMILPMADKMTFSVQFSYDNLNNRLVAGGLYSESNFIRSEGFFFLSIAPQSPNEPLVQFTPYDDAFVATIEEKDFDSKNKGVKESDIQEIIHRRDGGILMVGERNRRIERQVIGGRTYDRQGGRYIIDYYYDDLFVISIHPDGSEHWKTILHKKQYSQDDGASYSSYFLLKTPTALRFLFNDEIKYENTVSEYVINGSGDYDRNSIMSTENQKIRLRFRDAVQVSANELIVPSDRRTRFKLVRVSF